MIWSKIWEIFVTIIAIIIIILVLYYMTNESTNSKWRPLGVALSVYPYLIYCMSIASQPVAINTDGVTAGYPIISDKIEALVSLNQLIKQTIDSYHNWMRWSWLISQLIKHIHKYWIKNYLKNKFKSNYIWYDFYIQYISISVENVCHSNRKNNFIWK